MEIRTAINGFLSLHWTLLVLFALYFTSCKDDDKVQIEPYDSSKPVEINDFTPKKGGAKTDMIIYGSNFGTDPSIVSVRVGGKEAKVINAKGNTLYCITPERCYEGTVEVTIGESPTVTISEKYIYERQMVVTTLCGYVDELGKGEIKKEGPFNDCGKIDNPTWFSFDPKISNILYLTQDDGNQSNKPMRILYLEREWLSTGLTATKEGVARMRSISWTLGGDTMVIACSKGEDAAASNVYAVRKTNFMEITGRVTTSKGCQSSAIHPINGELYYNRFDEGAVFRYDYTKWGFNTNGANAEKLYTIQDVNWEFNFIIHPSGNYAYLMVSNQNYILRANYDNETKSFTNPYVVCGAPGQAGYADLIGTKARLNRPSQGAFVKNAEYATANKEELYDFYFTDRNNHCIRKLTPDGIVSTFAGRGSTGMNANPYGYVDGQIREKARFNEPAAFAYDEKNNIFYVGDVKNWRIRKIALEEFTEDNTTNQPDENVTE